MKRNYSLSQQLLACILLVSLCLQSCSSFTNPPLPKPTFSIQELGSQNPFRQLADKQLVSKEGHQVSFYEKAGRLQAIIKEGHGSLSKTHHLPVHIDSDINLAQISTLSESEKNRLIQVNLPKNNQLGNVVLYKPGLMGGGKSEDDQEQEDANESEQEDKETEMKTLQAKLTEHECDKKGSYVAPDFTFLPIETLPVELLEKIIWYLPSMHLINEVRQVNRYFYQLITGYSKPGLMGVRHKPIHPINTKLWEINPTIDLARFSYDPENIPSFYFYQLMERAWNLHPKFWTHLEGTNVHTIDLSDCCEPHSSNNLNLRSLFDFGAEKIIKLAKGNLKDLFNTKIRTIDLSKISYCSAKTAVKLFQYVQEVNRDISIKGIARHEHAILKALEQYKEGILNIDYQPTTFPEGGIFHEAEALIELTAVDIVFLVHHPLFKKNYINYQEIDLNGRPISHEAILELFKYLEGLKSNILVKGIAPHENIITEALKEQQGSRLTLRNKNLIDIDMVFLVNHPLFKQNCIHYQEIDLSNNQLTDISIINLFKYLQTAHVHTVDLSNNNLTAKGAIKLARHLQGTKVHTVDLSGNRINEGIQELLHSFFTSITWEFGKTSSNSFVIASHPFGLIGSNESNTGFGFASLFSSFGISTSEIFKDSSSADLKFTDMHSNSSLVPASNPTESILGEESEEEATSYALDCLSQDEEIIGINSFSFPMSEVSTSPFQSSFSTESINCSTPYLDFFPLFGASSSFTPSSFHVESSITSEHNSPSLYDAVEQGDIAVVRLPLEQGTDVNSRDIKGELHKAVKQGDIEVARLLLEQGADVNATDSQHDSPLHKAVERGHIELVRLLLDKGANVNANYEYDNYEYSLSPIHNAAYKGHLEIARLLLEQGADVNATACNGNSPLHFAAEHGYVELARLLLDKGADVNATDKEDNTPFRLAILNHHTEVVKLLIDQVNNGSNEETSYNSNSLLHDAAFPGNKEVVKLLIEKGADINARDGSGNTLLHKAALNGYLEIVQLLLSQGANVHAKNKNKDTASELAVEQDNLELAKILIEQELKTKFIGE